jgi:cell division septum initiation protein DivIVA
LDVESAIQQLEQLIAEGRPVPLSSSVMVNRAEVEAVLTDMRTRLRDDLLAQAARESEQLMADTRVERERMLSETEVVRAANREAERILTDAREHARVLRLEAEDYVDGKLANFEIVLQKTLAAVEKGRERLRGRLATDDLAPPEQPPAAGQTAADRDPSSQFYDYEQLDQRP